jgi:cation:H+ antiporter
MLRVAMNLLLLLFGLVLLLAGGDALVRGAAALARQLGISPLVVGLTVVAFGTSSPELAVNVTAALRGSGGLSFGNVIGSNLANIGLVVGLAALLRPLHIQKSVVRRELPMMMLATAVAFVFALDSLFAGGGPSRYERGDGIVLLLLMTVFIYYTAVDVFRQRESGQGEVGLAPGGWSIPISLAMGAAGLVGLLAGARFTVQGAEGIARVLGVSEAVIGLTLVAIGTSLPELAASMVAAWRGQTGIAIGNVIGSNLFNLLLVLGATATIRPIPVPVGGNADLTVLALLSVLFFGLCATRERFIIRAEGAFLLTMYVLYLCGRLLFFF